MNRKKGLTILCLLLFITLTIFLTSFLDKKRSVAGEKPIVYASFFPIYNLTKTVAGDAVDVRSFMPTSATVHAWEPTPKSMKELEKADLLIVNGANMERWVPKIKKNLPNLKIISLSDYVDLITYTGAAALGEFQLMQRASLKSDTYELIFGHTHEDYLRIAFLKDDKSMSDKELIEKGRKILEKEGEAIKQKETIHVKNEGVYKISMSHESGEVKYKIPEAGDWIIYTDRKPEEILTFDFLDLDGKDMENEIIMESSSKELEQVTFDPHSWLSINNAKSYLGTISRELTKLDPKHENTFRKNRFKAVDELTLLEYEYLEKFGKLDKKEFIVMHYAFEYLARDFGLVQYPLQSLTSMDDPSIHSMVKAIDYAKKANIKTIFYEYGKPASVAKVIAEEVPGGKVASLASMEYVPPGYSVDDISYYELMKMNLENLYKYMFYANNGRFEGEEKQDNQEVVIKQ